MMFAPFFALAAVSPNRQWSFRVMVGFHVLLVAAGVAFGGAGKHSAVLLGQALLVAGIVEGALLIGWRLTQMPKSQALEFLLVSPLRPPMVLFGEAMVGLARLGLVTLSGLPLLLVMVESGTLLADDVPGLLLLPLTWGAFTGFCLTAWAYEGQRVQRWGERFMMAMIVFYLVVGLLAGENLRTWLAFLPPDLARWIFAGFRFFHEFNPFGVMKYAMENPPWITWERELAVCLAGLILAGLALLRSATRLKGHFHDRHYRPVLLADEGRRLSPGDRPLAWWAVKRVTEYSGRINLWLAGGFAIMYAIFTVAQDAWPSWLGREAFAIFDRMGGIPVLTTAMVLLGAVPAAFQYGLWDSNSQDRCRRLELLLLTPLDAFAYWDAACAAAWKRGKGYLLIALLLWWAGLVAGKVTLLQFAVGMTAGTALWGLYFAVGFWAFTRGHQANMLGLTLTLGMALLTFVLYQLHEPMLAGLLPPGSVYQATAQQTAWPALIGAFLAGGMALGVGRWSLAHCDRDLRRWYDSHHGNMAMD